MKTLTIYLTIFLLTAGMQQIQAQQEKTSPKIERLEQKKEEIISEEKAALKERVESINRQLENREITRQEAERLKEEAAKKHALNIENRLAIVENEIAWLSRNENGDNRKSEEDEKNDSHFHWGKKDKHSNPYRRTTSQLVIAAGFNNAIEEGQDVNNLEFKEAGSRFFEIGIAWKTRVFNNSNWMRLRYGVSFQFDGLKPKNNRYFVEDGDLTVLEVHPIDLNKSKFRMDKLVFPLHFEFGPSRKIETERGTWFSADDNFKIGLGGYAGFMIGERQKLKYEEGSDDVKLKLKNDYNTNDIVYGLSAYIGWGSTSLYAKYDLNPIFQEPNTELYNVSLGLRFDFD